MVSGVTTAYNRKQLWLANESLITKLQARCRGYLVRKAHRDRLDFLKSQDSSVTCIQVKRPQPSCLPSQEDMDPDRHRHSLYTNHAAENVRCQYFRITPSCLPFVSPQAHWKGFKQRKNFKDRKQHLKDHSDEAVKVTGYMI